MKFILFICFLLAAKVVNGQTLVVYPSPEKDFKKVSDIYLVSITQNGQKKKTFVYKTSAGNGINREWGREQNKSLHFVTFSFSGTVTVEVIKLNSSATSAIIRPSRLGIISNIIVQNRNRKLTFKLNKPSKIAIEFNDDLKNTSPLMLFADTLEKNENLPNRLENNIYYVSDAIGLRDIDPNKEIVYFKSGVYNIGYWDVPSNIKQVYIAGGAYVIGYLNRSTNQIKINGRGVVSNEGYTYHYPSNLGAFDDDNSKWFLPINIKGGERHLIEGITIIESTGYNIELNAKNSLIDNVKICGFRLNNDGITIIGQGHRINNCFLRVNDDAIVIYASNLAIDNCSFWQLQGSVVQFGWRPHSMSNINILNCDVLYDEGSNSEGNIGFINAMNRQKANDRTIVKNVNISNVYFDTPIIRFLDIRGERSSTVYSPLPNINQPWVFKDFKFSNIFFSQNMAVKPLIYLHGFSTEYPVLNFTFQNIYFNKKKLEQKLFSRKILSLKNAKDVKY